MVNSTVKRRRHFKGETITENRRVIKIGSSYYLNVPPEFVEQNGIKAGTKVPINCDHLLKVIPNAER